MTNYFKYLELARKNDATHLVGSIGFPCSTLLAASTSRPIYFSEDRMKSNVPMLELISFRDTSREQVIYVNPLTPNRQFID